MNIFSHKKTPEKISGVFNDKIKNYFKSTNSKTHIKIFFSENFEGSPEIIRKFSFDLIFFNYTLYLSYIDFIHEKHVMYTFCHYLYMIIQSGIISLHDKKSEYLKTK